MMDTLQHVVNQLRNLNLPVSVSDEGIFTTDKGVILRTAVPSRGLLSVYQNVYPTGIDVIVRELASAVCDEVEDITAPGCAGRYTMLNMSGTLF